MVSAKLLPGMWVETERCSGVIQAFIYPNRCYGSVMQAQYRCRGVLKSPQTRMIVQDSDGRNHLVILYPNTVRATEKQG